MKIKFMDKEKIFANKFTNICNPTKGQYLDYTKNSDKSTIKTNK